VNPQTSNRALIVIIVSHFLSAFGVLGMSPYYATILEKSFGITDPSWAGIYYVVPLFMMAFAGPVWGAFGDRFGKKLSLNRAQIGLAVALSLCGLTHSWLTFGLCLVVQGIFGGTFSASNALLAEYYRGPQLAKALSYLQYSARLSLFLAPSLLGVLIFHLDNPLRAYLYLWTMPALSFLVMTLFLPPNPHVEADRKAASTPAEPLVSAGLPFNFMLFIEFWFTLMTVITFPYFVKYFTTNESQMSDDWAGVYFGTPHVVYLMLAFLVIHRASVKGALGFVAMAFCLFTVSMLGHIFLLNPWLLFAARALMGVALVFGFIYINELVAHGIKHTSAGRAFGWLDTASKFAGVFAGLGASVMVHYRGLVGPFEAAAAIGAVFGSLTVALSLRRQKI
jgi:MFS family permease